MYILKKRAGQLPLKKWRFEFSGSITEPGMANFYGNVTTHYPDEVNLTDIFKEPTKMYAIFKVGDFKRPNITGSRS